MNQPDIKAGCYGISPIAAYNESMKELPLKYFYYDIEIVDSLAQVKMTQCYYNDFQGTLQVQYIFPVHPDAAITELSIEFGGKKQSGLIFTKNEAEKQYQDNLNYGNGVAYGALNSQSKDSMKVKIGNIPSKTQVKIVLVYAHQVSVSCNTFYNFRLQTAMTPRYASTIAANQNAPNMISFDALPGANKVVQGKCTWGINLKISSQRKISKIYSTSHSIGTKQTSSSTQITFNGPPPLPNKDFVLLYTFDNFQKPSYALNHLDNCSSAVVSFIPKFCSLTIDDALKQAQKNKSYEVNLESAKGEYIFLLDRSGSMDGVRLEKAKQSLIIFLKGLPEDSYFNVLSFGTNYAYLFPKGSVHNDKNSINEAIKQIQGMKANFGGTQILNAIQNLMTKAVIPGYARILFFLTDGAIENVDSVFKFITHHTQYTRINAIGIGDGCSRELIQGCARRGKGRFIFISDAQAKPSNFIIPLLEESLSPVISTINLNYDKEMVESIVPNPESMPFILKNEPCNFYITFKGKLTQPFNMKFNYTDSSKKHFSESLIIQPDKQQQCKFITSMVNYKRVNALMETFKWNQSVQDRIFYVKTIDKKKLQEQIIKQSIERQVLTQLTAFICVQSHKANQLKENSKYSVNIKSMVPFDHNPITFADGGFDDSEDQYVDQCCVVEYEQPSKQANNPNNQSNRSFVKKYRPTTMLMINAATGKPIALPIGTTDWKEPNKRLTYPFIITNQENNGSWIQNFIPSLWTNDVQMINKLREQLKFVNKRDLDTGIFTFLVYRFLIKFYPEQGETIMTCRKAKEYITRQFGGQIFEKMQKIFAIFYKQQSGKHEN